MPYRWVFVVAVPAVGFACLLLGLRREAVDSHQSTAAINAVASPAPDSWTEWNGRGKIAAARGHPAEALRHFDRAIWLNPDLAVLYANRGGARLQLGDREGAVEDCSLALSKNPSCVEAWLNRAQGHVDGGEWALAVDDYARALDLLAPSDRLRGQVLLRLEESRRRMGNTSY